MSNVVRENLSGDRSSGRTERLELRLPEELKREIESAASLLGVPVSSLVLDAVLEKARRVKREHNQTILFGADAERFARMLEEPPAPTEALIGTLRRKADL